MYVRIIVTIQNYHAAYRTRSQGIRSAHISAKYPGLELWRITQILGRIK